MTLGLFAKDLLGRTTRIPVPLTLLDACLVRAIALFLAAPLVDISINQPGAASDGRAAASGFVPSALLGSLSVQRCSTLAVLESPGRNRTGPPGSVFWQECRISSTVRVRLASACKTLGPRGESFCCGCGCAKALAADGATNYEL